MGIIQQLPKEVAERIAAGEVVERPASVVKELVENSIDAGAKSITIDVADGGKGRIAVADDGMGMDPSDLGRCVMRHATSKIASESDLFAIRTLGFRGEALAAIGAVSRMAIESKPNRGDVIEGARIRVAGGRVEGPVVAGTAGGTKVDVADLFFNVPARKKFLRSPKVEYGHISDVVVNLALAFPDIRFELRRDGRCAFKAQAGDLRERVLSVLGDGYRDRLCAVRDRSAKNHVCGWVALEGMAQGRDVYIFLNRRPVRDRMLMHAVGAAFGESLIKGQYTAAVLWIEIDPAVVDVNVHPTKREVRFANSGAVHDFVMSAVRKAVQTRRASSVVRHAPENTKVTKGEVLERVKGAVQNYEERRIIAQQPMSFSYGAQHVTHDARRTTHDVGLRPLGQLGRTYVVCEGEDGELVLIDQHAAHERLGYDDLKRQYAAGSVSQQRLLIPERVELGAKESAYVLENLEAIARAGFEVEPFGGSSIVVKAVPAILGDASAGQVFGKMAGELEVLGASRTIDEAIDRIFSVVACHRQVRAGDRLSPEELSQLVRNVEKEDVTHCPHGRPAIIRIEASEIEKWFKRRN